MIQVLALFMHQRKLIYSHASTLSRARSRLSSPPTLSLSPFCVCLSLPLHSSLPLHPFLSLSLPLSRTCSLSDCSHKRFYFKARPQKCTIKTFVLKPRGPPLFAVKNTFGHVLLLCKLQVLLVLPLILFNFRRTLHVCLFAAE